MALDLAVPRGENKSLYDCVIWKLLDELLLLFMFDPITTRFRFTQNRICQFYYVIAMGVVFIPRAG